jgi:hypothetical protein
MAIIKLGGLLAAMSAGSRADLSSSPVEPLAVVGKPLADGRQPLSVSELQSALNRAASGEVHLPAASFVLDSDELHRSPIQVPNGLRIRGAGIDKTFLEIIGSASCNVFDIADASNVRLSDLTLRGNGASSGYGNGTALLCRLRTAAREGMRNVVVERCGFENFGAEFWIWILNQNESQVIEGIEIRACTFKSRSGNAKNPSNIQVPAFCIGVQGSSRGRGDVRDVSIASNEALIPDLKGFVVVWQGTKNVKIESNIVREPGAKIENDRGAYAIALYDNARGYGRRPSSLTVRDNTIVRPRSCGIYIVMCGQVVVSDNRISGQFDELENTLPKAAIAVNGAEQADVFRNEISDCFGGIVLYAAIIPAVLRAVQNSILNIKGARGFGIKLGTTVDGSDVKYRVTRNQIRALEGMPIVVRMGIRRSFSELTVQDNEISTPNGGCIVSNPFDSSPRHLLKLKSSGNTGCS